MLQRSEGDECSAGQWISPKGAIQKRRGKKAILHIDQEFLFKQILLAKFAIFGS
jgi:hypothetical protein